MFLPRRLTMATRRQQIRAFRAVKQAQQIGVFPYDWRPPDTEQMIMEDPLQVERDREGDGMEGNGWRGKLVKGDLLFLSS